MVNAAHHERELVTMDRWHVEKRGFLRKNPGMLTKDSIWPQNRCSLLVWTSRISFHSEKNEFFFPLGCNQNHQDFKGKDSYSWESVGKTWHPSRRPFTELLMSEWRLGLYPGRCPWLLTASHHRLSMAKTLLQKLIAGHSPWSHYLSLGV